MSEKEPIDINTPISEQIKEAGDHKGLRLGDDFVNDREKGLYDKIIAEHGEAIASTREAMNADFSNLLEDVADLSEGNQRRLREVGEMLGVRLETKEDALQMNYELFQEILKFQRDHKMKLTGTVDSTLSAALKEERAKKTETTPEPKKSETAPAGAEKPTTSVQAPETRAVVENTPQSDSETGAIPAPPVPSAIPRATPVETEVASTPANTPQQYEGQDERILQPIVPGTTAATSTTPPEAPSATSPEPITTTPPLVRATPVASTQPSQEIPDYGKKVGPGKRKDIVSNAEGSSDILSQTTSANVLKTKGSTKNVIKILDKYLQENPEKREEMIQALRAQIGDFSRPLQTPEEVGAFQQLFYLAYPERFADEMKYIDGEYGPRTQETFMRDIYAINGSAMLAKITDAASVANLTPFEREVLQKNLAKNMGDVGANSSAEQIKMAQTLLALNGELGDIAIDGTWSPELEKLISVPSLSSEERFTEAKDARAILSRRYKITSSSVADDDGTSKARNRTGLVGLRDCAVGGAMNLANALGNPDGLRITGGTEDGHSGSGLFGKKEYTHGNGYKLDFGIHPALIKFTGLTSGGKVTKYIKGQEVLFYRHEPDHFDVTFYPVK